MTGPLVVVGDVLLDSDVCGRSERRSPDAGVPVVDVQSRIWRPGGAGLAALLAAREAGDVVLIGGFAADEAGLRLRRLLAGRVRLAALPLRGSTVCKQRVRASGPCASPGAGDTDAAPVSLVRMDSGDGRVGDDPLPAGIAGVLDRARAVLVADYGRGVAAHPEIRRLLRHRSRDIPLVWDPHPRGPEPVPGATLVTPNRDEAAHWVLGPDAVRAGEGTRASGGEVLSGSRTDIGGQARELARRWSARAVVITLGAEGALLSHRGATDPEPIPIPPDLCCPDGYDVCGAGDRFAAAAATALAGGASTPAAVRYAVATAARFVRAGAASGSTIPVPQRRRAASESEAAESEAAQSGAADTDPQPALLSP